MLKCLNDFEARMGFAPMITVLQTVALLLGYLAMVYLRQF